MSRDELIAELHRVVSLIWRVSKDNNLLDATVYSYFQGSPLLTQAYVLLVRWQSSEMGGTTIENTDDTDRMEVDLGMADLDGAPPANGPPHPERATPSRSVEVSAPPKAPTDDPSRPVPDRTTIDPITDAEPISPSAEQQMLAIIENAIATHAGLTLTPARQQLLGLLANEFQTATSREATAIRDLRVRDQQVAELEKANKEAQGVISQLTAILLGVGEDKSPNVSQMVTRAKELVEAVGSSKKLQEDLVGMRSMAKKKEAEWREKLTALEGKLKTAQTELEARKQG